MTRLEELKNIKTFLDKIEERKPFSQKIVEKAYW